MKGYGIRYYCILAFVAAGIVNTVPAQGMQRYLQCVKAVYATKQVYTSSVWRDDGADTGTDFDAAAAFDKFVVSTYHVDDLGMKTAECQQNESPSVAKSKQDNDAKRWVGKGYTVITTSWKYVK